MTGSSTEAVLLIVCNAKPRDEARAVPDLKVAVVEHFLGLFNCFLIGIANYRVRPCDLVANRHFVNSVVVGGSHVPKYDTARREVECQRTVSPYGFVENADEAGNYDDL